MEFDSQQLLFDLLLLCLAATNLQELGAAVFHSEASTFMALVPLVSAESYIFQVFFKLLSLILLFALLTGVLVLPVLLSLVGPPAYPPRELEADSEEEWEDDQPRSSKTSSSLPMIVTV